MLTPDWETKLTYPQAEAELHEFKWDGPGLYRTPDQGDSLLAIPMERETGHLWDYETSPTEVITFLVYNGRDIATILNNLSGVPTRGTQ